jgi:hypothetical protein
MPIANVVMDDLDQRSLTRYFVPLISFRRSSSDS